MGLFKRNTPAPCHRHRSPIDSRDLDGTVSGSLAAFKFAISAGLKKQIRFFSERSPTSPDSFISKNEGMAKGATNFMIFSDLRSRHKALSCRLSETNWKPPERIAAYFDRAAVPTGVLDEEIFSYCGGGGVRACADWRLDGPNHNLLTCARVEIDQPCAIFSGLISKTPERDSCLLQLFNSHCVRKRLDAAQQRGHCKIASISNS